MSDRSESTLASAAVQAAEKEAKAFAERNFRGTNRVYCDGLHDGYLTGHLAGQEVGAKRERERCLNLVNRYRSKMELTHRIRNPSTTEGSSE